MVETAEQPDGILHPDVAAALALFDLTHDVLACPPELADTADFSAHYGFSLDEAANTILVASRKVEPTRYAVCVVLGSTRPRRQPRGARTDGRQAGLVR
jgi:hypothetical protein